MQKQGKLCKQREKRENIGRVLAKKCWKAMQKKGKLCKTMEFSKETLSSYEER